MSARASEVNPSPAIVKLRRMVGELRSLDTALAEQARVVGDAVVLDVGREDKSKLLDLGVEHRDGLSQQHQLLTHQRVSRASWRYSNQLRTYLNDLTVQLNRGLACIINPVVQALVSRLFKRHDPSPVDNDHRPISGDADPSVGEARDGADSPVSRRHGNPPDGGAA